ncbi:MAG: hypothetical protein EZS28_019568 [Streblomastix strix]|uniref:Uncharacterized protein n=1 Tax=Streblomastix strix TaxID=222440 RepID=A0A5J4VQX2_9EUKA|nr:MAG: hypothetical protein EZS28_019568 [Streblomastix strix]
MELLTERNTIAIDFWGEFDRSSERKGLKDANFECARGNKTHRDITAPNIEKRRYNRIEICACARRNLERNIDLPNRQVCRSSKLNGQVNLYLDTNEGRHLKSLWTIALLDKLFWTASKGTRPVKHKTEIESTHQQKRIKETRQQSEVNSQEQMLKLMHTRTRVKTSNFDSQVRAPVRFQLMGIQNRTKEEILSLEILPRSLMEKPLQHQPNMGKRQNNSLSGDMEIDKGSGIYTKIVFPIIQKRQQRKEIVKEIDNLSVLGLEKRGNSIYRKIGGEFKIKYK